MRVRLFVLLLASLPAIAQAQTALPPDIDPVTLSRLAVGHAGRSGRGRAASYWPKDRRPSRGRDPRTSRVTAPGSAASVSPRA